MTTGTTVDPPTKQSDRAAPRLATRVTGDLGGTWLRIRIDDGPTVRMPSPSRVHHPDLSARELVERLVTTLSENVPPGAVVTLSCGAALDEERGVAYGSGPLWGGDLSTPVPLRPLLEAARPDATWCLVNDVTAALAAAVARFATPGDRKLAYLTVSSGIALRTIDLPTQEVAVDRHGLQGEVGHLRAASSAGSAVSELRCLCGQAGHVAAISSGPALAEVARALGIAWDDTAAFSAGLARGDYDARTLLGVVVEPIAELLRTMRVLDPRLDTVVVGGGVAEGLAEHYEFELLRRFGEVRSYADVEPSDLRVQVCRPNDIDPLSGAAAVAAGVLHVRKEPHPNGNDRSRARQEP